MPVEENHDDGGDGIMAADGSPSLVAGDETPGNDVHHDDDGDIVDPEYVKAQQRLEVNKFSDLQAEVGDDDVTPTGAVNGADGDKGYVEASIQAKTEEEDVEEWMDVIGSGDLMKRIIRKGQGNDSRPQRGDIVRLNVTGKLANGHHVEVGREIEVTVGDAEVIQGLDLAIPLMELEEIAEVVVKPRLAYGKLGKDPDIPPNATIAYTIELLTVSDEPEIKDLSYSLRTQIGNRKRERGNFWFGRGEYSCALQCYRRALEFLDEETGVSTDSKQELKELLENRIKVYNNMAAAQLKIGAFDAAFKSVDNVLKVQPTNVKALFRKGKILECMGQTAEAITTLKGALQLEPDAKVIHYELSKLAEKQKSEERTERELYRRMLGQDKNHSSGDVQREESKRKSTRFVKWGFVAAALTVGLVSVAVYRHLHGL